MVRVPQRDTESMIAWVLRFLEANLRVLHSRKPSRSARPARRRRILAKTA